MDERWEELRARLHAQAVLFEDPSTYVAGVEDALAAARDLLDPPGLTLVEEPEAEPTAV